MTTRLPVVVALGEVLWDLFPDGARFGGAPANFAQHAAALGAEVWLVTGLGDDDLGREALERLRQSPLILDHVSVLEDYPTGRVQIELNQRGEASYHFGEDEAWDHLAWSDELAELSRRCDAVCFGTLGQRSPDSRRVIEQFVAGTSDRALRVLDLNLRPPYTDREVIDASLQMANVLKLNDSELKVLAEHLELSSEDEAGRLIELAERMEFRAVALTQGPRGALLFRDGKTCQVDSRAVPVEDTVGAGDAFNAAIVIGLIAGAELETIGQSACRIAEYVCAQKGATPQIPDELVPEFSRAIE